MSEVRPTGSVPASEGRGTRTYAHLLLAVGLPVLALVLATLSMRPAGTSIQAGVIGGLPELDWLDRPRDNGEFQVAVLVRGEWQDVGSLGYRQFPFERTLDLASLNLAGEMCVRIAHAGDTAAHIDSVLIDGMSPSSVQGTAEEPSLALRKLASRDSDLVDAQGRTLVLTFDLQGTPSVLSLVARIDPDHIPDTPYQFPLENLYQTMDEDSAFYTYVWDSQPGRLEVDGDLAGEELGEPFFEEFITPGSGHPPAPIYGWVWNDTHSLYVAIDFVSDNTMDGDADYATVYVNTQAGLRSFRVSVLEQEWGMPGFTYTRRAVYQHKVYEFAISMAELGLAELEDGGPLELAFAAYGTVTPTPPSFPGRLDPSFGVGGIVTTSICSRDDYINAIAIQPDGKIVVAGSCNDGGYEVFALARYNQDGSLDPGFGTGGIVTTSLGAIDAVIQDIALQSDGMIVAAGQRGTGPSGDFALARYRSDGSLDLGFGLGGVSITPIGSGSDGAHGVAIQPDGKIVAVGTDLGDGGFAVVRYDSAGGLDSGFGSGGIVTTPIESAYAIAYDVVLQPNGRILAVGKSGQTPYFALARYLPGGGPDLSFGNGGVVTTPIGTSAYGMAVALQPNRRIVVAGYADIGPTFYDFAVARYTVSGTLDTSFGATGVVTTEFGNSSVDAAYDVALRPDGKIVAAGVNVGYGFALVRYNADGTRDGTFSVGNSSGKVNTPMGTAGGGAPGMAMQADGKIVAAGHTVSGPYADFALVRYGLDLRIHKAVTPTWAQPGDAVTYTLVFSNNGASAFNVHVTDTFPSEIAYVTGIHSSGVPMTMTVFWPSISWDVGQLDYGQTGWITVNAVLDEPLPAGPFINFASIHPVSVDCFPPNNVRGARVVIPYDVLLPLVLRDY